MIWAGAANSHTVRVDRVQHKFLMWLSHHSSSGPTPSLSYQDLCRHFRIPSLSARRLQHDLLFLRNIHSNNLNSPQLLDSFPLNVPARSTRNRSLFYEPRARVNTVLNGLFCRLPRVTNRFLNTREVTADIFRDSPGIYRGHVLRYVANP